MKKILYIEDFPLYHEELKDYLKEKKVDAKVEIVSAFCIEEAHYILTNTSIDAIVIDLQINHCNNHELAKINAKPINLTNYAPLRFSGIGVILFAQSMLNYINKVPKLVLSDYVFDDYCEYYNRLLGPKDNCQKKGDDDFNENNESILNWLIQCDFI